MAKNLISNVFFVDPETNNIDSVFSFSPFGMVVRRDGEWFGVRKEDSGINEKTGLKMYLLDWDKVALTDDLEDPDSEPEPVVLYDNGDLTLETLEEYADLVYDGTQPEETEESE
jgi:hypothetical protein